MLQISWDPETETGKHLFTPMSASLLHLQCKMKALYFQQIFVRRCLNRESVTNAKEGFVLEDAQQQEILLLGQRFYSPSLAICRSAGVEAVSSVLSEKAWLWEQVTGCGFTLRQILYSSSLSVCYYQCKQQAVYTVIVPFITAYQESNGSDRGIFVETFMQAYPKNS